MAVESIAGKHEADAKADERPKRCAQLHVCHGRDLAEADQYANDEHFHHIPMRDFVQDPSEHRENRVGFTRQNCTE